MMYRIVVSFKTNPAVTYALCELSEWDFVAQLVYYLANTHLYTRIIIMECTDA